MSYRPAGAWCDVCVLPDGRIAFVRAEGTLIICEIEGHEAWRVDVKVASLFLRCAALADGTVAAIVKANDPQGSALLILRDKVLPLGPTAGNNPVALTATHAYIVTGPAVAHRTRLDDGFSEPIALPWTSQGIRDVLPDGTIISADSTYAAPVRGVNFGEYQTRGDLTVGQHGFGIGVLTKVLDAEGESVDHFFLARQGPTNYGVHGAQSGSRIAVCAYTEAGSFYQEFTPPYPSAPVVTPPAPKPVPQPAPIPEPKPVNVPNRAAELAAFWQQWNGKQPITDDAKKHEFTAAFMTYLNQHDGSFRWGRKSRPGNSPVSKDTAAYWVGAIIPTTPTDGKIHAFDLISGGTGAVNWDHKAENNDPAYANIDARWYPVAAVSAPPAPPPVDSGSDLAALRHDYTDLLALYGKLLARIELLERVADSTQGRISNAETRLYALKPFAKSGDAVEVTGKIALADIYRSRDVTWEGKIK